MKWHLQLALSVLVAFSVSARGAGPDTREFLTTSGEVGQYGGRLVVAQRAEPKTLSPITAIDNPSREVIGRMTADLIHINRQTHRTEASLAKSWTASPDGRRYTVRLRHGLKFSDGHPFDADDVVFSFQVYLDEKVHAPQRDLLVVGGKPLVVRKIDAYTVDFEFAEPYAAGDRLFDGVAILPRHLLESAYKAGTLAQTWTLATAPDKIAGLGPFRLKEYVPGQIIKLERNPYYWKADQKGKPLPYLDGLFFVFAQNDDAQVLQFEAGETDVISRLSAESFGVLSREQEARGFKLYDVGPGLEYNFLLFNMNEDTAGRLPQISRKQAWFRDVKFRQAISAAVDRDGIVRLVYQGRGAALAGHVTPGNKLWINAGLPRPIRSTKQARELLRSAGFGWRSDGRLIDASGQPVEFTIAAASNNGPRKQMATIIQQDLAELGMRVEVIPLEFRSLVDRVTQSHDYEAAIMGLGSGDVDPTAEMNVWVTTGSTHLWNMGETHPAPWQTEIDKLMKQQLTTIDYKHRKELYDRVQQLVAEELPIISIASPNILVGANSSIGNFQPSILNHYALSNVEELFWRKNNGQNGSH
jgi:peptide/nickel transport system substrate-binding protein